MLHSATVLSRKILTLVSSCLVLSCTAVIQRGEGDENSATPSAGGSTGSAADGGTGAVGGSSTGGGTGGPLAGSSGSGVGGTQNPPLGTAFTCDPSAVTESPALRRLTRPQYENTVTDLLAFALGDRAEALTLKDALGSALEALPSEERPRTEEDLRGTYRRLDQGVSQGHVDTWYQLATRVGGELTTEARLARVVGTCATDGSAAAPCIDAFLRRFGERALRRPLTDDEVTFYGEFYGDTSAIAPVAFADLIAGLLTAPDMLYLIESGDQEVPGLPGTFQLGPFEVASRLSYHFWDTMPDDELFRAAKDGTLLEDDEYRRQTERLVADPRTKASIRNFHREWLKLDALPALDQANGVANYDAFTGDDQPGPELTSRVNDEVLDLLDYFTWDTATGLDTVLTSQLIFPKTDDLAALYGVSPAAEPFAAPLGDRPGLFTRVAFLATGASRTRPIMKGVFLRQDMLCDELSPPPPGANSNIPELEPTLSTREKVQRITEVGTCAGCHVESINPLGFSTESYDALGRFRDEELLFDAEGELIGSAALDTTSVPQVVSGDLTPVSNVAELMSLVVASGKVTSCLARHYFRYSFGRFENLAADGCALEGLRTALAGGTLDSMVREVAFLPDFRRRRIVE